jgi:hypothetical protein
LLDGVVPGGLRISRAYAAPTSFPARPVGPVAAGAKAMVATMATRMDFEQTLQQLHAWLGQPVAVSVSPAFEGSVQVAVLGGTLAHTEEPPDQVKSLVGAAGADEILFFFVEREVGDRRDSFVIPRMFFEYAFMQPSAVGGQLLVIMLRSMFISVRAG